MELSKSYSSTFSRVILFGGSLMTVYLCIKYIKSLHNRNKYERRRETKRKDRKFAKKRFEIFLNENSMEEFEIEEITKLSLVNLVEKLKAKELAPETVLLAYQHKAFCVDKRLNCVVEFLHPNFSEINLNGPLAGVPVSLKECLSVKGSEVCAGCAYFVSAGPQNSDAVLVKMIKELGGVPFVITTVPQSMLSLLSSNPIDGVTRNPLDIERCPGGSSSGEAALIGGQGSPLGFGTDLGGSIRIPAAMCNIVGFKPTPGRLSVKDVFHVGYPSIIKSVCGPLTRDAQSCEFLMELLFSHPKRFAYDPTCPPFGYDKPEPRKLKVGYYFHNTSFLATPAARRAVLHVAQCLRDNGHTVVEWKPPLIGEKSLELFLRSIFIDGGARFLEILHYDVVDHSISKTYKALRMTKFQKYFEWYKASWTNNWEMFTWLRGSSGFSSFREFNSHLERLSAAADLVYRSWMDLSLDVVLSPCVGYAAPLPLRPKFTASGMASFASFANLFNLPAGTIPSGVSVSERDLALMERSGLADGDSEEDDVYRAYTDISISHSAMPMLQKNTIGHPVNVQISALPWKDELCLYAMREIELFVNRNSEKLPN